MLFHIDLWGLSKLKNTKKLIFLSLMTAIGIVLQVIESYMPFPIDLPGGKIGIANVVGLIIIPMLGGVPALVVAALRACIGSLLFGGVISAIYSVSGAIASTLIMIIAYKYIYPKASLIGVGVIGAVAHNTAQVTVATILLGNVGIFSYLPILMIISIFTGGFSGLVAQMFLIRGVKIYD